LVSCTDPPLIGSPPTPILSQVSRQAIDFADSLTLLRPDHLVARITIGRSIVRELGAFSAVSHHGGGQ
jgi:hypothetical protein